MTMAFDPADTADTANETLTRYPSGTADRVTICVPAYRDDPQGMIAALRGCAGAAHTALIIYDDGSGDPVLTRSLEDCVETWPGPATLVTARLNKGRSHARNRLLAHAVTPWLLLLDADMLPDDALFLARYTDHIAANPEPALIAGGFSLTHVEPTPAQALHAAQSRKSDCLPAARRNAAPGRYVFTSNILVHRQVLTTITFNDNFKGWGWEDVEWGLRVERRYPITHIDNTATHIGLESSDALLCKFGTSGENYLRLVNAHPGAMAATALERMRRILRPILRVPGLRSLGLWSTKAIARNRIGIWPMRPRLFALKLFRAIAYTDPKG